MKWTKSNNTLKKDSYGFDAVTYIQDIRSRNNARRKKEIAEYSEDKRSIIEMIYGKLN